MTSCPEARHVSVALPLQGKCQKRDLGPGDLKGKHWVCPGCSKGRMQCGSRPYFAVCLVRRGYRCFSWFRVWSRDFDFVTQQPTALPVKTLSCRILWMEGVVCRVVVASVQRQTQSCRRDLQFADHLLQVHLLMCLYAVH